MPAGLKKHTVAKGGKKTTLCGLVMVWQLNGHTHTHTHIQTDTQMLWAQQKDKLHKFNVRMNATVMQKATCQQADVGKR